MIKSIREVINKMRNPVAKKKEEEVAKEVPSPTPTAPVVQEAVVEREINLSLINDKLNYVISTVNKIAEACEVDLNK